MDLYYPTQFRLAAVENPELWKSLVGIKLEFRTHGHCIIQKVSMQDNQMVLSPLNKDHRSETIGLDLFLNDYFGPFFVEWRLHNKIQRTLLNLQNTNGTNSIQTQDIINSVRKKEHATQDFILPNVTSTNRDVVAGLFRAYKQTYEEEVNDALDLINEANEDSAIYPDFFDDNLSDTPKEKPKVPLMEPARRQELVFESCNKNGIDSLFHFTRIENLEGILKYGLISQQELKTFPPSVQPNFNDPYRLDKHPEANCLSISFPNSQMFYKLRCDDPLQSWVVLILKSSILWELDCAFCRENAASSKTTVIPLEERQSFKAFKAMFRDYPGVSRDQLDIPDNYPIHPQAEVLVFDRIDPSYIKAVHFPTEDNSAFLDYLFGEVGNVEFEYDDHYFKQRSDWEFWKYRNQR